MMRGSGTPGRLFRTAKKALPGCEGFRQRPFCKERLKKMENIKLLPELMLFRDGRAVTADNWEERRREILGILSDNIYGRTPAAPGKVVGTVTGTDKKCCAGHAVLENIGISFDTPNGEFTFPMHLFMPVKPGKKPVFVMLNFRPDTYDRYYPAEEIVDRGYALAVIHYKDVTSDDGDFSDGLAGMYPRTGEKNEWGKIGMWAFAASRALDYLLTRDDIDPERIAVCGHSRLGKTALWAGAQDVRFALACSNDSGCAGAAYERIKHEGSETLRVITDRFPFWFCPAYREYAGRADEMPFDQHWLIAACCPRLVCVNSASLDKWADQESERLSCVGASPAWELFGASAPQWRMRDGTHFFSRADWNIYMDFFDAKA